MITTNQIQRAKQKVAKIQEDQLDAPIINVIIALDKIENKEHAVLKEIERKKLLQEAEIQKVAEIKDGIVDESGFLAAKEFVALKSKFSPFNIKKHIGVFVGVSLFIFVFITFFMMAAELKIIAGLFFAVISLPLSVLLGAVSQHTHNSCHEK